MKKILTRFGEVEYDESKLLHFPSGLVGLPNLHDFIVMPNQKEGPLFWIQSVEIKEGDECLTLVVVTVPEDLNITLNLAAPILYSPVKNRAIQVILDDANKKDIWSTRTPLPDFKG